MHSNRAICKQLGLCASKRAGLQTSKGAHKCSDPSLQDGLDRWLPQQQQQLVQRQTQAWSQHRQQQQPEQQQTEGAYLRSDTPSALAGSPATWQGQRFVGPAGEAGPRLRAAWISWQQHHQAQVWVNRHIRQPMICPVVWSQQHMHRRWHVVA